MPGLLSAGECLLNDCLWQESHIGPGSSCDAHVGMYTRHICNATAKHPVTGTLSTGSENFGEVRTTQQPEYMMEGDHDARGDSQMPDSAAHTYQVSQMRANGHCGGEVYARLVAGHSCMQSHTCKSREFRGQENCGSHAHPARMRPSNVAIIELNIHLDTAHSVSV